MFEDINNNIGFELVLALGAFLMSMFLTPIYTNFAYKHKLWKKQKSVAITGEELTVSPAFSWAISGMSTLMTTAILV